MAERNHGPQTSQTEGLTLRSRGQTPSEHRPTTTAPCKGRTRTTHQALPQSLHLLSVHIVFSTKERRPWLSQEVRPRLWAYQAGILQKLECYSITVGGVDDHVHVLCNLTKKIAPVKVLELLKKDSSKFVKTLGPELAAFHWQDGYGLFSVSPSHVEAVQQYIRNQEVHHRVETFQEEFLRIREKYPVAFDERPLWF